MDMFQGNVVATAILNFGLSFLNILLPLISQLSSKRVLVHVSHVGDILLDTPCHRGFGVSTFVQLTLHRRE